jgi:GT2 family glycosyltransferase
MEIAGRNYRVAVVIMMMEKEFAATRVMMASLLAATRGHTGITISLLLNGSEDKEIEGYFTKIEGLRFYRSKENLGIAGGRNFLLTRPQVVGSDIIMSLDNDLVLPTDYVRKMSAFLIANPDAGIVGSVMLWGYSCKEFLDAHNITGRGANTGVVSEFLSDDLKKYWVRTGNREGLYYLGPYHWFLTDLMATPSSLQNVFLRLEGKLGIKKTFYFYLHNNPDVIRAMKDGIPKLNTRVVSGCAQVFHSELPARVGLLETAYNPYGHEDHEFSIRVERAGYTNYTSCDVFAIHGFDERHPTRDHAWLKEMYTRRRVISTRKIARSPIVRALVLAEIFLHTLVTSAVQNILAGDLTFGSVRSGMRGFFGGATIRLTDTDELIKRAALARRAARPS